MSYNVAVRIRPSNATSPVKNTDATPTLGTLDNFDDVRKIS